jgi:Cu2+-exporting ATPase
VEDHTQHHNHHTIPEREASDGAHGNKQPGTAVATAPDHHNHHAGHGGQDDHMVHSHGQHAGHSTAMFKDRFWLTLALSVPVVYFSPMVGHLLGYTPPEFPGSA